MIIFLRVSGKFRPHLQYNFFVFSRFPMFLRSSQLCHSPLLSNPKEMSNELITPLSHLQPSPSAKVRDHLPSVLLDCSLVHYSQYQLGGLFRSNRPLKVWLSIVLHYSTHRFEICKELWGFFPPVRLKDLIIRAMADKLSNELYPPVSTKPGDIAMIKMPSLLYWT